MPCGTIAYIGRVGHNNNGFPLSVQLFENIHHIAAVALVQTARRFICKNNVWGFCNDFCQCHPLLLTKVDISFEIEETALHIRSEVRCHGETGVEMEALTAVSVAALTVYDMCKAVQRDMRIDGIHLLYKEGGKSGVYEAEE